MQETSQILRVANDIATFIVARGYEPGERLPSERDLTERFSVGRNVIREALVFLEASRLIERRRNSGIFLNSKLGQVSLETLVLSANLGVPLERRTIGEITEARTILEVQAVAIACERRTDADLQALAQILRNTETALARDESIAEWDFEFHIMIFKATQNGILVRLAMPFFMMERQRREVVFSIEGYGAESHSQHVDLVEAIEAQDTEAATDLAAQHIGRVQRHFLRLNSEATTEGDKDDGPT